MTEIIIGERGSGKTTELIKRSAETGSYILVATKMMARCIHLSALDMGYHIPYPITIKEYLTGGVDKRTPILIDELDLVLGSIFNLEKVEAVTLTKKDYHDIKYLEKPEK